MVSDILADQENTCHLDEKVKWKW